MRLLLRSLIFPLLCGAMPGALAAACDAHFKFDGDLSDASGNGYHGELLDKRNEPIAGARFAPGLDGSALRLNGDYFVRAPLQLDPAICPKVTFTGWLFLETDDTANYGLFSSGSGQGPQLSWAGDDIYGLGGGGQVSENTALRRGIWMFIGATWDYDAGVMRVYWRDRYQEVPITAKAGAQEYVWLGAQGYHSSIMRIASGALLDDVRIEGRVLTPLEIALRRASLSESETTPAAVDVDGDGYINTGVCDAYYPMDGNLNDLSGNRLDGLAIDAAGNPDPTAVRFGPGRHGQALHLDGSGGMVAPLDLHFSRCPKVTITAWVYADQTHSKLQSVAASGYGAGPSIMLQKEDLRVHASPATVEHRKAVPSGQWRFVAGRWDYRAGTLEMITPDGVKSAPIEYTNRPPEPDFWVGINSYLGAPTAHAQGLRVDDVRVFGSLLTDAEIAAVAEHTATSRIATPRQPVSDPLRSIEARSEDAFSGVAGSGSKPLEQARRESDSAADETQPLSLQEREALTLETQAIARGAIDPKLERTGEDPAEKMREQFEAMQEQGPDRVAEQRQAEYERNFGVKNRAQIVVGQQGGIAFVSGKKIIAGPDEPPLNGPSIVNKSVVELLRFKTTNSVMALLTNGELLVQGNPERRQLHLFRAIKQILLDGRAVDLIAEEAGGDRYVITSGTRIYHNNLSSDARSRLQAELDAGYPITAFSFLGRGGWIAASERDVFVGGLNSLHYGLEVLAKARELQRAGERIDDISVTWVLLSNGGTTGTWAIATDKNFYYENPRDCDNHEKLLVDVEFGLDQTFACHVPTPQCPNNRQTWSYSDMESPFGGNLWDVNVLVTMAVGDYDGEEKAVIDCWLEESLQEVEQLFDRTPAVRIKLRVEERKEKAGQNLQQMIFESGGDYRRFMEDNFDIVAPTETSGYFQVVVTEKLCIGKKKGQPHCVGGRATFPHAVEPFSRKYGIALKPDLIYPKPDEPVAPPKIFDDTTLAHEFGHYFGLKHTFEPYGLTSNPCNREYDANWLIVKDRYCRSCKSGADYDANTCQGEYNVMDYCINPRPPQQVYINDCQATRASNTRDRYMKSDGKTDYDKMKGSK